MLGEYGWVFIIVFSIYMLILIAIGYFSAKKVQTVEDYYVAGRNIGPALMGIHYGTVYFSSVLMIGGGAYAYRFGYATLWIPIGNTIKHCCSDTNWILCPTYDNLFNLQPS